MLLFLWGWVFCSVMRLCKSFAISIKFRVTSDEYDILYDCGFKIFLVTVKLSWLILFRWKFPFHMIPLLSELKGEYFSLLTNHHNKDLWYPS